MKLSRTFSLLALAVISAGITQTAMSQQFEAGQHYQVISPAQSTSTDSDRVEVAEIFVYSCIHCYRFEPHLESWNAANADYINFVRIPAAFNDWAQLLAQGFYTAQALGKLEEMHGEFFREIHDRGNRLSSAQQMQDFFARFDVSADAFAETFNSFAVNTKVQRAVELAAAYRIPETPSIVVNGKYLSLGGMAGSYENWFEIIDELAAMEHDNQ